MRIECRGSFKGLSSGIPTPPSLGSPIRFEQEPPLSPAPDWPVGSQYRSFNTCNDVPVPRKLAEANVLMLLTPLLSDVDADATSGRIAQDPFERLGRAIAAWHPRVRHLPYHPGAQPTVVHKECLKRAGAVVIVLYESMATESPMSIASLLNEEQNSPGTDRVAKIIDGQVEFARWTCETFISHNRNGAAVTVTIGPPKGKLDTCLGRQSFQHVVHCASRAHFDACAVAGAIFGKPSDDTVLTSVGQLPSPVNV